MRTILALLCLSLVLALAGCEAPKMPPGPPPPVDLYNLLNASAKAVDTVRADPGNEALSELLPKARGVIVFPHVEDASLVFGGSSGDGVLVHRKEDGTWSAPAFYRLTGINAGLVVGATKNQLVMLIMDDAVVKRMAGMTLDLGGSVRQIDGRKLKQHAASLNEALDGVVTFVGGDGFWLGLSASATYVSPKEDTIRRFYGEKATADDVLFKNDYPRPEQADALYRALDAPAATPSVQ
ncbi:hypothetical protein dsx2_0518 [Desulfovibrio sp. X2]|uniref:lipid-binding SYLF domain-containing protein n=1 Tax=Desulfovibrio sp. X2 TaxID=941449 RepID=UPI000358A21B|nr:lipid-binding SYLF domain-containing protein [Desulfovibrio sp. X2]EPR38709.1 hypothetical protein dsx2_0518 [Desulfovibrio sp. X2]